ncbi:MAG: hypothetical protein V1659_01365 [Candidatus Woesearchaeota archaeon]
MTEFDSSDFIGFPSGSSGYSGQGSAPAGASCTRAASPAEAPVGRVYPRDVIDKAVQLGILSRTYRPYLLSPGQHLADIGALRRVVVEGGMLSPFIFDAVVKVTPAREEPADSRFRLK